MDVLSSTVDDSLALRKHLDLIAALAREAGEAELLLESKRRALADAILDAYDDRVRPNAIYEAAGITKQRLYQLVHQTRARHEERNGGKP